MQALVVFSMLIFAQLPGEGAPQGTDDRLKAVLERAAKEPDLDEAGLILYSAFADESLLRSAYLTSPTLDERSLYILLGGNWGSRADITLAGREQRQRILVELVSAKPELIRSVLRAGRYEAYYEKRINRGDLHYFPFFSASYIDDVVEESIERLRKESSHPAEARPGQFHNFAMTAEEVEWSLLRSWQLLCGVCNRLDLINGATTKNWRNRYADLDRWFQKSRPYIMWDGRKSCIRIDEDAREFGIPTSRDLRSIPELEPTWRSADEPKD